MKPLLYGSDYFIRLTHYWAGVPYKFNTTTPTVIMPSAPIPRGVMPSLKIKIEISVVIINPTADQVAYATLK